MKKVSAAQAERYETKDGSGRFSTMNACECCGKSAGHDYYSDDRCNTHGGVGLILCKKCAEKLEDVSDADYLAAFQGK